jgi:hypothetical protein
MLTAVSNPSDATYPATAGSATGPVSSGPEPAPYEWHGPSWSTRLFLLGVACLAVAVTAVFGGLEKAPAQARAAVPTIAVNDSIDAGPWRVGVTNAGTYLQLGSYRPSDDGDYLLAVAVRIEILAYKSSNSEIEAIARLPEFSGLVNAAPKAVALIRDASPVVHLNPGIPERVAFIFEVKAGTPAPDQVVVELSGWTATRSILNKTLQWQNQGPRARVTVPVKDQRSTT